MMEKKNPETEETTLLDWTTILTKSSTSTIIKQIEATDLVTTNAALKILIIAGNYMMVNVNDNNNNNNDDDYYNRLNAYDIVRVQQRQR